MIKSKVFVISAIVAVVTLVAVISVMGFRITSLSGRLENNQQMYNQVLDNNKLLLDEISQNLQIISSSNNEVRRSLNLPMKQLIQQRSDEDNETQADAAISFFEAFRYLVDNDNLESAAADFSLYIMENEISEYFTERNFTFQRNSYLEASVFKSDKKYIDLEYKSDSRNIRLTNILGDNLDFSIDDSNHYVLFDKEIHLIDKYEEDISDFTIQLADLLLADEVSEILEKRELSIIATDNRNFVIKNLKDKSVIGIIRLKNLELTLNNEVFTNIQDFKIRLIDYLENVSNRTEYEKIDDMVLAKMNEVFSDEGFKLLLETNNCKTEVSKREDDEFIYFDIYNLNGSVKGSYALQKEFGEVLLLTGDGKYLKSLNMFTEGNNFKSLIVNSIEDNESIPYLFDDSAENFLVVGTHEHNADTMIIVNANNKTGQLNMISVPRDLYYKGQKINNIYKVFGPERLASELSEITGLDIKKFISIDMFAFIDVVNILGGLDVTLEEDLIDPTYKVKNNGIWSTLYYRKGTHHLDGVASLRVARSRHGSSDFDRSRRQQLVIKAIMDKMKGLDAGDINKVYDFVTTVSSYINTNLTIADIVKNFLMYKDNEVADPNIINTDNILYATYTNLYLLSAEEQKTVLENDDYYKGLWIVLPENNDWNLIKKYIESILTIGN